MKVSVPSYPSHQGTAVTMRDYTEAKEQQLGSLGCRSHGLLTLMAQLFYLALFTVLLVAFLVQVPKVPSTKDQESIYQKLTKLKVEVDLLCRPCPWDWMLFQNNCYFFSKSKRNWTYSITACEDMGAQLVITTIEEEKSFLQEISKKNGKAWIGLSDLKQEGSWQWVDGSLLLFSFSKFWNTGEPNNVGDDEDCVELDGDGWNDADCTIKKFWICKKSVTSCSKK